MLLVWFLVWEGKRNQYCKTMSRSKNNKRKKLYRSDEKGNKAKVHTNMLFCPIHSCKLKVSSQNGKKGDCHLNKGQVEIVPLIQRWLILFIILSADSFIQL